MCIRDRLEGAERPPLGMEVGRRPVGVLPAVVGFAGEAACGLSAN